jgi:glutathione S-transferase
MKLFYSVTSPYSRKVLLLAKSLGMGGEVDVIHTNPLQNDPAFMKINPLGKVPALVQGGKTYVDSPYIAEHLLRLAGQDRTGDAYMNRLEVQAYADGIMDAAVALRIESTRPEAERSDLWQKRWYAAIDRGLAYLEANVVDALSGWKLDSISVACMLDYLLFRLPGVAWQKDYPKLAVWFAEASNRKDMLETDPRQG